MLNKGLFLGLALCTAMGASAQKRLQLDVTIKGLPEGDSVFLWAPLPQHIDTAVVKNGHFRFDRDMSEGGTTYILQVGTSGKQEHGTFMYLEAGKVNITGNGPYFKDATYTGSPFVADWVDIQKNIISMNAPIEAKRETLYKKLETAVNLGDQDAVNALQTEVNKLEQPMLMASWDWIMKHPNSGAASFLINANFGQKLSKGEFQDLMVKMGPEVKNTFTIKKMSTNVFGGDKILGMLDKAAPAFVLNDMNGKTISLADYKGKYVLVDFWASWCKPCREAVPALTATYNKFKDKGFTIVSVSMDDKKDKWLQAIAEEKMPWAQVSDLKGGESQVAKDYGVMAIPAAFLVDPNGKVIALGTGEQLEKKLAEVLK
ncbi:peroxiredoxin [Chitinophaga dinghuensis]|uniref:Peroxiredoxin n=1 Tax=Chitinophaga dinghuensis TaxID=1539050 RepID=A0A327W1T0_9BACT|nr:AhpC/TSA family protein [Chitinophaga dinghuensis]RAJ83189.1 peroxiredoxin [Chitinophaga dinghuensis]